MARATLAQGTLGPVGLWIMAVVASSPLTVLVAGIPTMYAATGVVGTPLAFVAVGVVLLVLAWPYAAAAGHVRHAAPLYALLARGRSPVWGVAAGVLALEGYTAIGTSLYGLAGPQLAELMPVGPWWVFALAAWLVVAVLGLLGGVISARLLGGLLALEIAVIVVYMLTVLAQAEAITFEPLTPTALVVPGMAGVIAFAMAAFVGVETIPAYGEEARGGRPAVRRAMLAAVAFTAAFYALGAWAMAVQAGPHQVANGAADPLAMLGAVFGSGVRVLATLLLITSVVAAMTSFHLAATRYVFAMAREGVLPGCLKAVSERGDGGTPVAASLAQSGLAGVVIAVTVWGGFDPMAGMFAWLSTIGAVALLTLLLAAAAGAYGFFAKGLGTNDSVWVRRVAPWTGGAFGVVLMATMLSNLGSLLGLPPQSRSWWLVPLFVAATAAVGVVWGLLLRWRKPHVVAQIGTVVADPVSSPVARLGKLVM